MINHPANERTTADPPDQFGQDTVAELVIRISFRATGRLVAVHFALACGLEPRFERIDARIFTDGFPGRHRFARSVVVAQGKTFAITQAGQALAA